MVHIEEMGQGEIRSLLGRLTFGHLGCARNGRPYVIPIHFVYVDPYIYLYTTEGMKTEFIASNSEVCLQVEEIENSSSWRSIIVTGRAEHLEKDLDKSYAMGFITERNPTLTPAISVTWTDAWGRASVEAVYRIQPQIISGRKALPRH